MTVNEFRAWLEGFGEVIKGSPTKAQWDKIKTRLAGVSQGDYARYYYDGYHRPWWPTWTYTTSSTGVPVIGNSIDISWTNKCTEFSISNLELKEVKTAHAIGQIEASAS